MESDKIVTLAPKSTKGFVETPQIKDIIQRAMTYIKAGFPVHFRGPSGTGKTSLTLRIAEMLTRPVIMLHGDDERTTSDFVGAEKGYHRRSLRDNFIQSVLKIEEEATKEWVDNRLTVAVEQGYTLIYDEFTRSRPEANNVLLSVLQEGILDIPTGRDEGEGYIRVHPDFTALFTSNPEEYAGVHRAQDALRDRMITIDLEHFDRATEVAITASKSGLSRQDAESIVDVVRELRDSREYEFAPTVRGCIMVAKSVAVHKGKISVSKHDERFRQICLDIIASETSRLGGSSGSNRVRKILNDAIDRHCNNGRKKERYAISIPQDTSHHAQLSGEAG